MLKAWNKKLAATNLDCSNLFSCLIMGTALVMASSIFAPTFADPFIPGDLIVTRSVYTGTASTVTIGQTLPPVCGTQATCNGKATDNGQYPNLINSNNVWNNDKVDGSFGITSPIFLDQLNTSGAKVSTINLTAAAAALGVNLTTSFSSKSELAVNLSTNGSALTLMGYIAPANTIDVSNSNTPGHVDPTNPVGSSFQRAVAQINADGSVQVTPVNAYSGNNGRAVVFDNVTNQYFMVGNAGNGSGTEPTFIVNNTGVQITTPGGSANTTVVGVQQGTPGQSNGFQFGFSVAQTNPATGLPYGPADKSGKDDNFRGETIFNNTLYVTKGSGSNGINTVYQVGAAGSLPTLANAAVIPMTVLPGFPTGLANAAGASNPFGIWFADTNTVYVADEGDGTMANAGTSKVAGLQKWSLVNGVWKLDYVLQNGLNLGVSYTVPNYPTALDPETDGLRNITGHINDDGTVTIYGITSTVSSNGDQGADPNKLVAITDVLANLTANGATSEQFITLDSAGAGEVLRGVAFAPVPEPSTFTLLIIGLGLVGFFARRRKSPR
ncbi:MAG TPA: PEP-CTERM sorting domain-containing protein [Candidatus Acidoferrales bacterium]|nr:PEP-CTERM sorting domain-containing protein [Candidatus Acidoferrales bacterium]